LEAMTTRIEIPEALRDALRAVFRRPIGSHLDDRAFNALALEVFGWQFENNSAWAAYCARRGRTPTAVSHWTEIPPVPVAAFREAALVAGDPASAAAVFRTSGTTRGAARRGTHYVADVSLYHESLLPSFAAMVLPDGATPVMVSLIPRAAEAPDSSLSHMVDTVSARFGAASSLSVASVSSGIDSDRLDGALRDACDRGHVVCLLGTSFAFVHWLDELRARGRRYRMPPGSRIMDTGGFKGRSREVDADTMREEYAHSLGIDAVHCINEYGMTEMCSQFYDSTFRDFTAGVSRARHKVVPPWVRTRLVDADTLEPVAPGEPGLLQHFDLANAGSVCAIQTEDTGVVVDEGFRVIGRASGAQPRGCSLAMDDLLQALAGKRR
jgi:Acyl-protein synthetase, LuxE